MLLVGGGASKGGGSGRIGESMKMREMEEFDLEDRFPRTEGRVRGHFARYGCFLFSTRIVHVPEVDKDTLATHRYPGTVVARDLSARVGHRP